MNTIPEPELTARRAALAKYMSEDHGPRAHAWPAVAALDREQDIEALVVEWRRLRFGGMVAGSQCVKMTEQREKMLAAGCWREIYE